MASPLATWCYIEVFICTIHLPPWAPVGYSSGRNWQGWPVEIQLCTFFRLFHIVKYLREHHPMRYNRMTEVLRTVASVKLSSAFLLKSYFLKNPLTMLFSLYLFNIFAIGYVVFALEVGSNTSLYLI